MSYESSGRTRQKARTRAALVHATRELLAGGASPTVEQAADRSGISRTTAYRYFRNQRELLLACYPHLEDASLLGPDPPEDVAARLDVVLDRLGRQILDYEHELRATLRLSLESASPSPDALPLRRGRAIRWIEDALSPLRERMSPQDVRRLAISIRAAFGIEPLVWLVDVARLDRADAVAVMRSSVKAILATALADATTGDNPRSRG